MIEIITIYTNEGNYLRGTYVKFNFLYELPSSLNIILLFQLYNAK